jgi:Flp pilus assembly CpaE family ATPase
VFRNYFSLLVIDVPPLIDTVTATVLDNSDPIILVVTPEVGAIQSTVAMLQVLDEMRDRTWIVLNQISPKPSVPLATVQKALQHPVTLQIPYDPAQMSALAQGKPLAWVQPSSPLVQAVGKLFAKLNDAS